ncbi:type II toxin-antitoxin system VapC family toxin [Chloroflexi bacterium CFX5]|nr:type II toxin-antitoxin system VapC family toxin [Chloroflexi bacterium CFX5]NUQ58793.1 type II toxin-antitoxin system VapC family toxin [Anaerolineales bacterium]
MNIVDSSGWLEYFAEGDNADFFAPAIEDTKNLLVPVICIYEVFKKILTQSGINEAQVHVSDMKQGQVIEIDESLALSAAKLSTDLKLPMADSLILAAARANNAVLWTQDEHFKDLEGVRYVEKKY